MKDPLKTTPNPYDVLDLKPGASTAEVRRASKEALGTHEDITLVDDARRQLIRPVDRALVDLFLLQDHFLKGLESFPTIDDLHQMDQRHLVMDAWRQAERSRFPDPAATHSIAVLSYWEVVAFEEAKLPSNVTDPISRFDALWDDALQRFAALIASDSFWDDWSHVSGNEELRSNDLDDVKRGLELRLESQLHSLADAYRIKNDRGAADRIERHRLHFHTELHAARDLASLQIRPKNNSSSAPIVGGPRLLDAVNLLDYISIELKTRQPNLVPFFSRNADIAYLIQQQQYERALTAIHKLNGFERASSDVRSMLFTAHLELGNQEFDLDHQDVAFDHWKQAHTVDSHSSVLSATIGGRVRKAAAMLQGKDDAASIALVERALSLSQDAGLTELLAVLLMHRGIGRVNRAQRMLDEETTPSPGSIRELEAGIADVDRAANLDPSNAKIVQQQKLGHQIFASYLEQRGISRINHAQKQNNEGASQSPDIIQEIEAGISDINRAANEDPSSDHIRQQLQAAQNVLMSVKNAAITGGRPRSELERTLSEMDETERAKFRRYWEQMDEQQRDDFTRALERVRELPPAKKESGWISKVIGGALGLAKWSLVWIIFPSIFIYLFGNYGILIYIFLAIVTVWVIAKLS